MRKFMMILAVGAFAVACTDQDPVSMATDPVTPGPAVSSFSGSLGGIAGDPWDLRQPNVWASLPGGAQAQSGGVQGTGAGTFPSFLLFGTAQGRDDGKGYNTDAGGPNRQYEISGGSNTRSVPLNSIPTIAREGTVFREFRFDGQAPGAQAKKEYSVDDIRIYLVPNVAPNNAIANFLQAGVVGPRPEVMFGDARLVWDMNPTVPTGQNPDLTGFRWIWISSDLSSGQGASDMRLLVPNQLFLDQMPQSDWAACAFDGYDYAATGSTTSLGSDCPWALYFVSAHGYAESKQSGNSEWSVAFRPTLLVTKTAEGKYDRSFDWEVEKSVDQDAFDMFRGDEAVANYTVTATKGDPVDSNVRIEGVITIENVASSAVTITGVSDILSLEGKDPIAVDVDCPWFTAATHSIPAGATRTCTYSHPLDAADRGVKGVNDVIVTADDPLDDADDGSLAFAGFAAVEWDEEPGSVVNDQVQVEDVLGAIKQIDETISDSKTWNYAHTFACDADEGSNKNTVTLTGDLGFQKMDSATVEIDCYALTVEKDAKTSFTRTFDWAIDKWAGERLDPTFELGPLAPGEHALLTYSIEVKTTGYTDSDWAVAGKITVTNPAPISVMIDSVTDLVSPDIGATVVCMDGDEPIAFPWEMPAAADEETPAVLECTYTADLPNADTRTNTATATIQNRLWSAEGSEELEDGEGELVTTAFSGTAQVVFGNPTDLVDACVDVSDVFSGMNGVLHSWDPAEEVCVTNFTGATKTFTYTVQFGGDEDMGADYWYELECDENEFSNTATFVSQDNEDKTGSATHDLTVTVNCAVGCTLTLGYWMTHNQFFKDRIPGQGPPRDDTWDWVGLSLDGGVTDLGEASPFFDSGLGWAEAMWSGDNSNLYYQAVRRWVAAYLNIIAIARVHAGDDETFVANPELWWDEAFASLNQEVRDAYEDGLAFFKGSTPGDFDPEGVRDWMSTLNSFNEGNEGIPHCDGDPVPEPELGAIQI